jgi:hypothetical protein
MPRHFRSGDTPAMTDNRGGPSEKLSLTRKQLYDMVWSTPMLRLARQFECSSTWLTRICRDASVPVPPRGHWTKKRAGKATQRRPLPRSTNPDEVVVSYKPPDAATQPPPSPRSRAIDDSKIHLPSVRDPLDAPAEATADGDDDDRILVPERLSAPIGIVAEAKDALRDAQEGESGMLKCPEGCWRLTVSRKALGLTLRVADALFKACEHRGWLVRLEGDRAVVTVDSIPIAVAFTEGFDRSEAPPEVKPGYYSFHYNRNNTYVYRPSGQLTVTIESTQRAYQPGVRRNWHGTAGKPLEAKLASVLVGMNRLAMAVKADNEERARREQEAAERERAVERARLERERVQRAIAEEKARVESLLEQSRRWHTAHTLRQFLEVARERGATGKLDLHGKDLQDWLSWAVAQADRLDPFVADPAPRAAVIRDEQGHP